MTDVISAQVAADAGKLESQLSREGLPQHVSVIMDGNGRWGVNRGVNREYGHRESVDAMRTAVTAADDLGISFLSLFCFSTENVSRPLDEVESLFALFNDVLDIETLKLHKKNVRIVTSGLTNLLPDPLPHKFDSAVELTADNTGLTLNLCVMYSGRSELLEAVQKVIAAVEAGTLDPARIDEQSFREYLYHPELPDADLVIRTSGELRISNFMLWQLAYSELVFTEVLWPDFTRADFMAALLAYQHRRRRFGRV